jgi:hypothetical protein
MLLNPVTLHQNEASVPFSFNITQGSKCLLKFVTELIHMTLIFFCESHGTQVKAFLNLQFFAKNLLELLPY